MTTINLPVGLPVALADEVQRDTLARYGKGQRYVPEENATSAYVYSTTLQNEARKLAFAARTMGSNATSRLDLTAAALMELHPVELNQLSIALAKTVAAKDISRIDGRYSEPLQNLADRFRFDVKATVVRS